MIKDKFKIPKEEAKSYPPLPEDVFQVELFDVVSEMRPKYKKPEEEERVLKFQFVLLEGEGDEKEELRGRNIWRNFVPASLYIGKNGKNVLYEIVEAIFKHELSPEEEATMDSEVINSLIGQQCRIMVKNKKKDDKTYSNVASFLKATKKLKPLTDKEKLNAIVKPKDKDDKPAPKPNIDEGEVSVEDLPL